MRAEVAIIGGGMFGAALAYGLRRDGRDVVLVDQGDVAHRAARGNFGLVWVQSKGVNSPAYAAWTRRSADLWADFAAELADLTGIDPHHHRPGGLEPCLTEHEFETRKTMLETLRGHSNGAFEFEMLDARAARDLIPGFGQEVIGASYSPQDGHAGPLNLLRALHAGYRKLGGQAITDAQVDSITPTADGFMLSSRGHDPVNAERIIIAAGLGNKKLAAMVGIDAPIEPLKGQIMVTEKVSPFLTYPLSGVRQTAEGGVLLGGSHEDVGFQDDSSAPVMAAIADRARRVFPFLANARILRSWAAIRPMAPDGLPIYDQSATLPGAFVVSGHSGVTLAAVHAMVMAPAIAAGHLPPDVAPLNAGRFHE